MQFGVQFFPDVRPEEKSARDYFADCLDIAQETVKTRLHRARGMLRRSLYERLGESAGATFQFGSARCDRVVAAVLAKIAGLDAAG